MTKTEKEKYKTDYPSLADDIDDVVQPAYICTTAGLYGGSFYESSKNYRALQAYSAMSPTDRSNFEFNYDALDLLIDPTYGGDEGKKYQYDGKGYTTAEQAAQNRAGYSLTKPIDYTATYNGSTALTYTDANGENHEVAVGAELLSPVYETLPNEQRHYAAIKVDAAGDYYVVNQTFVHGETPYAVGNTVSAETYESLTTDEKALITKLNFSNTGTYYYCRESYQVNEKGEGVTVTKVNGEGASSYTTGSKVPVGFVIGATNYTSLPNKQENFTIHGKSPMETSTLYVARNADINDLSTEKIITVVYKYDYEESDVDGLHITPVSERHVVNIHINFKSGVPEVEDINPPTVVLPGTGVTMRIPTVTPGAYEITGGGWELFRTESNAESHTNGVSYTPSVDPLYWYQDGFYLAYYAKTYMGKTYSNYVPVSVANYHDLKRVMDDVNKAHHMYIDNEGCKREPKIYINDYSKDAEGSKNGLDLFKNLYDLSLLTTPATSGALEGHALLNERVKGGQGLEFFLRTDIDHSESSWTAIGTDDQCFEGNFHGDGHTISGLDNSLFYNLCGNVYNLGVTGSFSSAGVVDKGSGYVESAWINTTGTPDGSVRAVFGAPNADSDYKQIVNSYYQTGKNYKTTDDDSHGLATAMSDRSFYNGEVAYDLNNFYLYKRYSDKQVTSGTEKQKYSYFTIGNDGNLALQNNHYYNAKADLCSTGYEDKSKNVIMYVEDRFADGDFRYAGGTIPETEDERFYTWTVTDSETGNATVESAFFPIWPDDYIFFGQKLTYGWSAQAHQNVPTAVVRADGRLSTGDDANRVYRAPAYFRSKDMDVAHFNPQAYLAQTKKDDPATKAYPGMTAIDFKGHKDLIWALGTVSGGLPAGGNAFYPPLLDDDGLLSITNCDETQNLLAYAPAADANAKTYSVLNSYFTEPVYSEHYNDSPAGYRLVTEASGASVHGHLVQSDLTATSDHLLVDKQDFNAPLAYTFDGSHLMWYQRVPADNEYVDTEKGWQGISIPFSAELVTTNQKGEITHFYNGSSESDNGTGTKKGHEYWLREFKEGGKTEGDVYKAVFGYPSATGTGKTVANAFLWDYYYKNESVHNQLDKNADTYLQYRQYYKDSREYPNYPLLSSATPYILGLPGVRYFEFDLSGNFEPQNRLGTTDIEKLPAQVITLASNTGATIGVSDTELAAAKVTADGYTFTPSYLNEEVPATTSYPLNATGSSFDVTATAAPVGAFRPYFTKASSSGSKQYRSIIFGDLTTDTGFKADESLSLADRGEGLRVSGDNGTITIESGLKTTARVRIVNAVGITMASFMLEPGATVTTQLVPGVYIVAGKKVAVR